MRIPLRKAAKRLLWAGGIAGLVLALCVGGFRLLVTRLPSYQTELQAWVTDSLGLELQFSRLDAHWGLRGPELTFHDARVGAVDQPQPFVTAAVAGVGLSPFQLVKRLLFREELEVDRLTLEGTELTLVQAADGSFHLQGAPAGAIERGAFALEVPPDVEVLMRDSRVVYRDERRNREWDFADVSASMTRDSGLLKLEASARPPSELGSRLELTAQGAIQDSGDTARFAGDWRVFADVRNVDLAVAARVLPETAPAVPQAGRGDVSLWLQWQASTLEHVTANLALDDVALPRVLGTAGALYERIAFTGDWQRNPDGWRLVLNDVAVTHAGRVWPGGTSTSIELQTGAAGPTALNIASDFLRLEDLTPFFAPLPQSRLLDAWFALAPRGDLRSTLLTIARRADDWDYTIAADVTGLTIEPFDTYPGLSGATGEVRADARSGRVEFRSRDAALDWPAVFRETLALPEVTGILVWRQGQDAVRVVSDDLVVATRDGSTRSNLELTLPLDGSSPRLDLKTRLSVFALPAVKRYLPVHKMPPAVVTWLDQALQGGRVFDAQLAFFGPVRAFPFDGGEGEFRATAAVEAGVLAYMRDWPAAEELNGTVEFVNASFAARGSGRVLGNRSADVRTGITDMRNAVFTLQTQTIGPLDQVLEYLRSAPLIARHLGPQFASLAAPFGTGEVSVDLALPLKSLREYQLAAALDITDGELQFAGLAPHASEINGTLSLQDGELGGAGLEAIFLDGPVTARVVNPNLPGYRALLAVDGEVTIDAVARTFNLPRPELLAGQTQWQGSLLIPAHGAQVTEPARISVSSNLSGVALRFPAPLAKAPAEASNLQLDLTFTTDGGLEAEGYLGATRRFAMQFDADAGSGGPFAFRRAALRFGGALPEFRADRGVTIDGSLPLLRVDDWLALARSGGQPVALDTAFAGATLDVAEFSALGQQLGSSQISVRRRTDDWQIDVDSGAIAGTVLVPADLATDPQIVAVMRRLYLNAGGSGSMTEVDPRKLPGLQLHADEFAIGPRQLGALDAEILADPLGLRLVSFESTGPSFTAQGSGAWFKNADDGDTTRFAVSLSSSDVGGMLRALGFDPFIEGETAEATASVYWDGPPSGDWMQHVHGDLALRAEKGSLLDVEPGAGRVLGLMSFAALPRRLALDFRDVFNRGFVFDEITADFVLVDGNAYTDNLKLTGPAADIGLVGRTGLRDRDYRQQAVVTTGPGKMLPTVGLLGGPGVAAALLIFTRIFKKPLEGIGRASYCVTGTWAEPMVERLSDEQLEQGELCAELPPGAVPPEQGVAAR
jgi:uncharacterized protein (TIGR02099 family)